ncbi:MAG: ferrous iron transport protein B [Anaerolineae bacterium]|nr:ferrous iron transport protein B [Anaerolineae bacterium]
MAEQFRIALAGNPNCGKTTLFNHLTGMHQHVGNWPGKTVEQKTGTCRYNDVELLITDLPGTYSLSAYSQEEIIARDFIIHEKPEVVVCVLDATNLERNLFLTVQILEMNVPVVIALNMADMLHTTGMQIDTIGLAQGLRSPVIYTAANRAEGVEALLDTVIDTARNNAGRPLPERHPHDAAAAAAAGCPLHGGRPQRGHTHHGRAGGGHPLRGHPLHGHRHVKPHAWKWERRGMERHLNLHARHHMLAYTHPQRFMVDYGREIEEEIVAISHEIERYPALEAEFPTRWLAVKLLEQDEEIAAHIRAVEAPEALFARAEQSLAHLRRIYGEGVDTIIADRRYGWINGLVREAVQRTHISRLQVSDEIDKVVTHPTWGYLIFFFLMWVVFKFSTDIASPYIGWIEGTLSGPVTQWIIAGLGLVNLQGSWLQSFLLDGVVAGVGGVLAFVPVLFFLYLALAILEDSGYMARAAFLMDKVMHRLGLHGKSFLPMVLGFGCTVPALYGTRTMSSQRDRILVGLLVPFMSCSAKLPVYVIIAAIFFPEHAGLVIFSLYLLGVATALGLGLLLKSTLFRREEPSPFVMELPPYRLPTLKSIWLHTWERTSAFIQKAWTVILGASIVIWILLALPLNAAPGARFAEVDVEQSAFARINQVIAPALRPAGFGSWESAGALMSGVFGKEIIVSTYAQIFNTAESAELSQAPHLFRDLGSVVVHLLQATGDTLKSIPMVVGINLLPPADGDDLALAQALRADFEEVSGGHGGLAAFALLVFILYYTPCLIALNAERQELGWQWMLATAFGQLALAWLMAVIVFQSGLLLGLG